MSKTGTMPVVRLSGIKAKELMGEWGACEREVGMHNVKNGATWLEGRPDDIMEALQAAEDRMDWIDSDRMYEDYEFLPVPEVLVEGTWRRMYRAHNKRVAAAKKALYLAVKKILDDVASGAIEDFEGRHQVLYKDVWPYCEGTWPYCEDGPNGFQK